MKMIPKLIEIGDEIETGSILHRCAPGKDYSIIKVWMKGQPENCGNGTTQKAINDVLKNVSGGTVIVKGMSVCGKGAAVLNTYLIKCMERSDRLVVISTCPCKTCVMKLVDESQSYRAVSQQVYLQRIK